MILAYLLKTSIPWRGAEIRVKMVVPSAADEQPAHQDLTELVKRVRTDAIPEVLVMNGRSFEEILHESCKEADIVFLGMAKPSESYPDYIEQMHARITGLPTTVLVLAAEELKFSEVLLQQELLTD